jgi:hypothetical protein
MFLLTPLYSMESSKTRSYRFVSGFIALYHSFGNHGFLFEEK